MKYLSLSSMNVLVVWMEQKPHQEQPATSSAKLPFAIKYGNFLKYFLRIWEQ